MVLFEVGLLISSVWLMTYALHQPMEKTGGLGVMMSIIAMAWNYLYNLGFDKALLRLGKPLYPRGIKLRALHSIVFEVGFMSVSIPCVMAWLGYTVWQALMVDIAFLILVPIYTMAFNWAYDAIFPVPSSQETSTAS